MPSVADLLNKYGTPPRDVMRDWLWQLSEAPQSWPDGVPDPLLPHDDRDWTTLEVSHDGRLILSQSSLLKLRQAESQLRAWLRAAGRNERARRRSARATIDLAMDRTQYHPLTENAIAPSLETARQVAKLTPSDRPSLRLKRRPGIKPLAFRGNVLAIALVALCVTCGVLVVIRLGGKSRAPVGSLISPVDSSSTEPLSPTTPAATQSLPEGELETLAPDESIHPQNFDQLIKRPTSIELDTTLSPELGTSSLEPPAIEESSTSAPIANNMNVVGEEPATDVMRQVNEAMQKAESELPPADTSDGDPAASDSAEKTWTIHRDQWKRTVSSASPGVSRSRETKLTLSLQCPDELRCAPSSAQILEAKTRLTWQLVDEDSSAPRACLVVQAQQRGKRSQDVELWFYGSSEDMPHLVLPLNRKWLDPLLRNLQATQARLQWMADAMAKSQGTSENRRAVSQQKKLVAEQLKLCKRLIEVVAQCDRLADLIDGQVTIAR